MRVRTELERKQHYCDPLDSSKCCKLAHMGYTEDDCTCPPREIKAPEKSDD